ncbi:MAG: hypothetical protein RR882_00940 [Comamonas sp.]
MSKKISLLERAEKKAGLAVELTTKFEQGNRPEPSSRIDRVESGRFILYGFPAFDDPHLVLSIAMHTYMDVARQTPGLHFAWNEAADSPEFSELGHRLLLCLDLLRQHLLRILPLPWNDGGIYLESAYVTLFQATLVVAANKVLYTYNKHFLEQIRWRREDVALLQRALDVALKRITRPWTCSINRRLYVEMGKTKHSIEGYMGALQKNAPEPLVLRCTMQMRQGLFNLPDNGRAFGTNPSIIPLASSYMENFKSASAYVALLKKTWPEYLIGHLIKVSQSAEGSPQCTMLFFLRPSEHAQKSWTTILQELEFDFARDHVRKFGAVPWIEILAVNHQTELRTSARTAETWSRTKQLVDDLFVRELRYRRFNFPPRSRTWSKGVVKGEVCC